jgi:hypothetical protein
MSGFSLATSSCVTSLLFRKSFIDPVSSRPIRRPGASSPLLSLSAKHTGDEGRIWCWARVAISAPISLTRTTEFLSLMNPLLSQMLGESASVEIQARTSASQ